MGLVLSCAVRVTQLVVSTKQPQGHCEHKIAVIILNVCMARVMVSP